MPKSRPPYSPEFRAEAVRLARQEGGAGLDGSASLVRHTWMAFAFVLEAIARAVAVFHTTAEHPEPPDICGSLVPLPDVLADL